MNTVTLIGNLTKDPELKEHDDTKICELRLAESNGHEGSPLYINVAVFGRQAKTCDEYLAKGRQVAVTGRLRFREWQAKEGGGKRSEHTIAADRVHFLGGGKGRGSGNGGAEGDS